MDVGDAKITINAEDKASAKMKGIETSLDSMGKKATKVGLAMMAAGVAIAAGILKAADAYTKAGDEVAKMAKRTGFGVETLSELRHVAKLSGSSIESLEKGVKRMSGTIEDAKDGLETYTRSFDKLGLSVDEVAAMAPEEQFWAIANAIADLEDPTQRAAIAMDFFGRAGTDMLPMLAAGQAGIDAMRQEARDLNLVFTDETAAAAEAYQDAITKMRGALAGLSAEIIEDIIPTLQNLLETVTEIIGKWQDWAASNPELAGSLLKLAGVLLVGGALLVGLGAVAKAIVAINAALVVMHALAGPGGWAKLAAGIAIAAGTIYGLNRLMEWKPGEPEPIPGVLPTAQFGGVVPGPFGSPMPIMAHGGEMVSGLHGEAMGGTTVNISMGNFLGDESSLREFVRGVKDIFNQDVRRTSFSGVNSLGYFPGSSAP